jgi:protein SCO1/2
MLNRRGLFKGIGLLPLVGAVVARAEVQNDSAAQPGPKREFAPAPSGREILRSRYFPNIELVTQDGVKVTFYDDLLKDKIVVLNMMYAHCEGVCPTITSNLKNVRKLLREQVNHDVHIYSLTIKPEEDSPAALKEYAEMHGIQDRHWSFLTGKPEDVDRLRHLLGFADPNSELDRDKSRHSGMLRYGNEPLAIWGSCQGSGEPSWIAQEIGFAVPREFKKHPAIND